jgi:predicted metal-dependent hydrolase
LAQVAGALAGAGHHQHAEAVARTITDPNRQADALAQVANELARAGETRSAARLAAAICAVGHWTSAVGPVLQLAPSAYTQLALTLEEH